MISDISIITGDEWFYNYAVHGGNGFNLYENLKCRSAFSLSWPLTLLSSKKVLHGGHACMGGIQCEILPKLQPNTLDTSNAWPPAPSLNSESALRYLFHLLLVLTSMTIFKCGCFIIIVTLDLAELQEGTGGHAWEVSGAKFFQHAPPHPIPPSSQTIIVAAKVNCRFYIQVLVEINCLNIQFLV